MTRIHDCTMYHPCCTVCTHVSPSLHCKHPCCPTKLGRRRRRLMVAALLPRSRLMGDSQRAVNSGSATAEVCLHYMHSQEPEQTQQLNFSHNTLMGLCAGTAAALEEPLCSSILGGGHSGPVGQGIFIKEDGKKVLTASYSSG